MVKLYVADISSLPDPLSVPEVLQTLPLERQKRIHNMKQEKSRKQSMGVGLLLQKVLALYHMQDSDVFVDEHGKPKVEGLEFSLSHSGNLVVCAVSHEPVGCDVEEIRKAPERVAERYFSCGEQEYLSQFAEEEYDRAFFRLWTMKESYVKMTGEGLGVPFVEYEVVTSVVSCEETCRKSVDGQHPECAQVMRDGKKQTCYLNSMEMEGHIISICAEESAHVEVVWENLLFEV
jgi:4'-phosphopantetheinyl transferase